MVGTNVRITHLLTSFALCFFRAVLFIPMIPFPIMAKKALTFIIIVATLACLAEMIRFFYGMISSPEKNIILSNIHDFPICDRMAMHLLERDTQIAHQQLDY